VGSVADLAAAVKKVEAGLAKVHHADGDVAMANAARTLRLETMIEARKVVDDTEAVVPANLWPLATYTDLLFLDMTNGGPTDALE
jgi:glutamine synthetase